MNLNVIKSQLEYSLKHNGTPYGTEVEYRIDDLREEMLTYLIIIINEIEILKASS